MITSPTWAAIVAVVLLAPVMTCPAHPPAQAQRQPRYGATTTIIRAYQAPSSAPDPVVHLAKGKKAYIALLKKAERRATGAAKKVLRTGRRMMEKRSIVRGSCWDWVNAVYKRAGFPNTRGKRKTVFKGSRKKKRFTSINRIQPGDWLYYVNYQYKRVPHSGIFIAWLNKRKKRALILSYRGARSRTPGGLSTYDLRSVYNIIRPQDG